MVGQGGAIGMVDYINIYIIYKGVMMGTDVSGGMEWSEMGSY